MQAEDRIDVIKSILEQKFSPTILEIEDESHQHVGHKSAGGAGHFKLTIKAQELEDLNLIKKHQAIYKALDDLMPSEIHALSIKVV